MEGDDDASNDEGLHDYMMTRDAFGVPSNLMGNHDENFFSMLGRIVALSATLEYRVLSFYPALAGAGQDAFTELSVSRVIRDARRELPRLTDPAKREMASAYLEEAKAITQKTQRLRPQPLACAAGWQDLRLADGAKARSNRADHR